MSSNNLPVKTRDIFNHHLDSTKWDSINHREGDIVISTAYKSGTTWVITTIDELLNQGKEKSEKPESHYPWVDLRVPPIQVQLPEIEAMEGRRVFKSHVRLDCLPYSPKAKYISICRDGRDVYLSLLNHYKSVNQTWYDMCSDKTPGIVGPNIPNFFESYPDGSFFDDWISKGWPSNDGETDGYPFWSMFDHINTWWEYRHVPNIYMLHYADMLADLKGSVREIAEFLDIPIQEEGFDELVQSLTFDSMKKNANQNHNIPAFLFNGGGAVFFNKGGAGRWKDALTPDQRAKYLEVAKMKLSPDCFKWLESGKIASQVDPRLV